MNKILKISILFLVVALSVFIHMKFIRSMQITNDEGAYLYDALNIRNGLIPYRDFLTKGLLFVYPLSIFTYLGPNSFVAGRFMNVVVSVLTAMVLCLLTKRTFPKYKDIGFIAFFIYLLFPVTILFTSYIQIQPFQVLFSCLSLLLAIKSVQEKKHLYILFSGLVLGLGYFVRVTSIAIIPLIVYLLFSTKLEKKIRYLTLFFFGFFLVITIFSVCGLKIYGFNKTLDMLGFEMAKQAGSQKQQAIVNSNFSFLKQLLKDFANESKILFKEGLLLTIATFLLILSNLIKFIRTKKVLNIDYLSSVWIFLTVIMYFTWIKFRTPYLVEFLPAMVISLSVVLSYILRLIKDKFIIIIFWALILISFLTKYNDIMKHPYIGSHDVNVIRDVSKYIYGNTEEGEIIFTASTIFPYVTNRRVPFDLSHPSWYGVKEIDNDMLLEYFPSFDEYFKYIRENKIRVVLVDAYTVSSFFNLHRDFLAYIDKNYHLEKQIGGVKILRINEN